MSATVSDAEIVFRLTGVSETYALHKIPVPALRDIDLTIRRGEAIAVVGPSGSGKSTLLHLLATVDRPSAGALWFRGRDLGKLSDDQLAELRSRQIGFVFQSYNLIPVLKVFENVVYPLRIQRRKIDRSRRERVMALLDEVGLAGCASRRPGELSGGQRQRVAVARALVIDPAVILADEPTASLDTATGARILTLMHDACARHAATLVISTHDPQVLTFTNRQVHIRDGRIEAIQAEAEAPA